MELDNTVRFDFNEMYKNDISKYQDMVQYLLNELEDKNRIIKEQKFRLDNIQYFLTSEISGERYGSIKEKENE